MTIDYECPHCGTVHTDVSVDMCDFIIEDVPYTEDSKTIVLPVNCPNCHNYIDLK